jgi:hypothetical protein
VLFSDAILTPDAILLSAGRNAAAFKTLQVPFGMLDGPHQFGFFQLGYFDVMLFGDFLDLVDFHDKRSPFDFFRLRADVNFTAS